jgi:hypothetical protein
LFANSRFIKIAPHLSNALQQVLQDEVQGFYLLLHVLSKKGDSRPFLPPIGKSNLARCTSVLDHPERQAES